MDYESLNELIGKQLVINFELIDGEGLPSKLCTKTFCQYEFYQTKDKNKQIDGVKTLDEEDTMSSEDEDDMDARMNGDTSHVPKRKKKSFKTKTVDQKTQAPSWNYKGSHLMYIDDDILMRLQADSLAGGVYGLQDGREKLSNKSTKLNKSAKKETLLDENEAGISEIEKLRRENAKLMRMLDESKVVKNEGMCTTCSIF